MADRRLTDSAAIVLGAAALMTPSFIAGHPNVFPDTSAYHLIGQWFAEQAGLHLRRGFGLIRHRDLAMFFTMAKARSPYYGLLLFFVTVKGSAWAMVAVQALAASALLALTVRVTQRRLRLRRFALIIGVLTVASSLPFFVSFVMPDVFLGLGAVAAILLLVFFDRLGRAERWMLGAFLTLTLTFHATNPPAILVIALVAAGALAARALPPRPTRAGLAVVAAAIVAAIGASAIYPPVVEALSHHELDRPPFLTARVVADGPGRDYLREVCAKGSPYVLCRFKDLPLTDANDILWAVRRNKGVFEPADYQTRLGLIHEEGRFVAAVFEARPVSTIWRLLVDGAKEAGAVTVVDTLGYSDRTLVARGPGFAPPFGPLRFCERRPAWCYPTPAQATWDWVLCASLLAAILYLVTRLVMSGMAVRASFHSAPLSPRMGVAVTAVLALLVANALLCGALSGVYPRYEMRIAWLAPLFAALAWLENAAPGVGLARPAIERVEPADAATLQPAPVAEPL